MAAIKGARAKQPYAIAMKDGSPFGLAGELAQSEYRRMGTQLCDHYGAFQHIGEAESPRMPAIVTPRATTAGSVSKLTLRISSSSIHLN